MYDFSIGEQPCDDFVGERDSHGHNWDHHADIHQCYGPYDDKTVERCGTTRGGLVSFCQNCHWDHHDGGWDVCGQPRENDEKETA